jgi:hypothetical protein
MAMVCGKFFAFFSTGAAYIGAKPHGMVAVFASAFFKLYAKGAYLGTVTAQGNAAQVVFAKHLYTLCGTHFACCKTGQASINHRFIFHNHLILWLLIAAKLAYTTWLMP